MPKPGQAAKIEDCYFGNLNDKCLPDFLAEIASGWTHITMRQLYMALTKQNTVPLKLFFEGPRPNTSKGVQQENDTFKLTNKRLLMAKLQNWMTCRNNC